MNRKTRFSFTGDGTRTSIDFQRLEEIVDRGIMGEKSAGAGWSLLGAAERAVRAKPSLTRC